MWRVTDNQEHLVGQLRCPRAYRSHYCSQSKASRESVWFCGRDPYGVILAFGGISRIVDLLVAFGNLSHYFFSCWHDWYARIFASTSLFWRGMQTAFSFLCGIFYSALRPQALRADALYRSRIYDLACGLYTSVPANCREGA